MLTNTNPAETQKMQARRLRLKQLRRPVSLSGKIAGRLSLLNMESPSISLRPLAVVPVLLTFALGGVRLVPLT
jgi:hypothetical protein